MNKELTARDAVELIRSKSTVAVCGLISLVVPEAPLRALGERFVAAGEPRGLTLFSPIRAGWRAEPPSGLEHLAHPGLVRRVFTSTFSRRDSPRFAEMATSGEIDAYCYPMGFLFRVLRESAAGSPGFLTRVGLHTYADPGAAPEAGDVRDYPRSPASDLVRRITIDGEDLLYYRALPTGCCREAFAASPRRRS